MSTTVNILIHTSVKLVTRHRADSSPQVPYFNPHEREARDAVTAHHAGAQGHFNPHEREARDKEIPDGSVDMILF